MKINFPCNMPNEPRHFGRTAVLYAISRNIPLVYMAKHTDVTVSELLAVQKDLRAHKVIVLSGGRYEINDVNPGTFPVEIYREPRLMALYDAVIAKLDPSCARVDAFRLTYRRDQWDHEDRTLPMLHVKYEKRPIRTYLRRNLFMGSPSKWSTLGQHQSSPDTPVEEVAAHVIELLERT